MSIKLTDLQARLRNVSEWRGSASLTVAREAIERIDTLETKLRAACDLIDSLAPNQGERDEDDENEQFIGECAELLR